MKILALFFLSCSLTFAQERFCIPWFSCVPYQFSFPYQFSSINTAQERFYTLELDWLSDLLPKHGITVGYIRYGVAPPGEAISEFQVMDMALHEKMQKLARPKERKLFLAKAFPNRAALVEFAQNTCARHGYSLTLENEVAHMFPNQEVAVTRLTQPITDFAFENQALGRIHYEIGRKIGIAFLGSDFPRPHIIQKISLKMPRTTSAVAIFDAAAKAGHLSSWTVNIHASDDKNTSSNNLYVTQYSPGE